jgi:adenylylsulfate kinase
MLPGDFLEIYCHCPTEVCEQRDPKGHYQRAREGKIKDFTGVSASYEEPVEPELVLHTAKLSIEESVEKVLMLLRDRGIVGR